MKAMRIGTPMKARAKCYRELQETTAEMTAKSEIFSDTLASNGSR